MKKPKVDKIIETIARLKIEAISANPPRPETYRALDEANRVAGWELARILGKDNAE
jgi:hypothetical protein